MSGAGTPRSPAPHLAADALVLLVHLLLPVGLVMLAVRLTQLTPLAHALLVVTLAYLGILAGRALGRIVSPDVDVDVVDVAAAASAGADRARASWEARLADLVATLGDRGMVSVGGSLARLLTAYRDYRAPDQADVDAVVDLEDQLGDDSPALRDLVVLLVVIHDRILHARVVAEVS